MAKRTNYTWGYWLEKQVQAEFKKLGYLTISSRGSKGVVDVIAMKPGEDLLIQCKRDGYIPPAEWNELYSWATSLGKIPLMAQKAPSGKGNVYFRLVGPKGDRTQPMEPWAPVQPFLALKIERPKRKRGTR